MIDYNEKYTRILPAEQRPLNFFLGLCSHGNRYISSEFNLGL